MAAPRSPVNPSIPAYHAAGPLLGEVHSGGQQYPLHLSMASGDGAIGGVMGQMNAMSIAHGGGFPGPMTPAYVFPDSQYFLAPVPAGQQPLSLMDPSFGAPAYIAAPHPGQFPHAVLPYPSVVPFTPGRPAVGQSRSDRVNGDAPPLDSGRRGSYSTNESTPATPYYAGIASREHGRQGALLSLNASHSVIAKQIPAAVDHGIDELLKQSPAIPKAVPAVFTPASQIKTLEQSLENRITGNRNVYIRGLHPTTDDDLLLKYTQRFGEVETSKAIIDTGTGACKGFGFAKFHHARDSERCIRGFHRLGYEVGFARESFNSRLKAEGDESSTNLYISNLPKHMTELVRLHTYEALSSLPQIPELSAIFAGYTIMSSKILRDSMGNSRGVGFARFESRGICDEIIKSFNGLSIASDAGNSPMVMNIRYADTPAQKELKRVTAERRQFRTNEYNIGAYGTPMSGCRSRHMELQAHTADRTRTRLRRSSPLCRLVVDINMGYIRNRATPRAFVMVNGEGADPTEHGASAKMEHEVEKHVSAGSPMKVEDDIKEEDGDSDELKSDVESSPSPSIKRETA
ncbi:unnamed protein product [Parascedosporium putredinis]|uniref:RRM domain-containing protein n=1 Tax=Parascedosporium putredinis TaxID=1442378 RepID=A0A9P1GVG6_9PEZI|nr:unnamed protein product [Parascedosporium putredinis]CAI7987811.1 unnamed protein product [Parascedosporium putredinis]